MLENRSLKINLIYFFTALLSVFILDQVSKQLAVYFLKSHQPISYLWGIFVFIYAENRGAWGGFGENFAAIWRDIFLTWGPFLLLCGLFIYIWIHRKEMNTKEHLGFGLIVGGGFGNLVDRFAYGYVVDFMYIGYGPIGTNIFNVADMLILTGVGFAMWGNYRKTHLAQETLK